MRVKVDRSEIKAAVACSSMLVSYFREKGSQINLTLLISTREKPQFGLAPID